MVNSSNYEFIKEESQLNINGYHGFHWNSIVTPSELGGIMWNLSPTQHHGTGNILACQSNGMPHDHNPHINVNNYWNLLFQGTPPGEYEFMPGGHFAITKEQVHIRSVDFYSKIVNLLETNDIAPCIIERLECYIFNEKYKENR